MSVRLNVQLVTGLGIVRGKKEPGCDSLVQTFLTNISHVTSCIVLLKDVIKVLLLQKGHNDRIKNIIFCVLRHHIWLYTQNCRSSTNKTDRLDITEILLKVALNTINQTRFVGYKNQSVLPFNIYFVNDINLPLTKNKTMIIPMCCWIILHSVTLKSMSSSIELNCALNEDTWM